jgi:hypothetical protein
LIVMGVHAYHVEELKYSLQEADAYIGRFMK